MIDTLTGKMLAGGYQHGTEWHREIAEANIILRTQVGSGLHGVTVSDQDDTDHMGICIAPPECVIGLKAFEQYEVRTQPVGMRSGPGDLDLVVYGLQKWAKLAANGNPTVLLTLFAPDSEVLQINEYGERLRSDVGMFLSREAGLRFNGYLLAQKGRLTGERSQRTNRPELIEKYGFDTKFAYHSIRLGIQGIELLTTGRVELPMAEPGRSWLNELREGRHSFAETLEKIQELRYILQHLAVSADLPKRADWDRINPWLVDMHQSFWKSRSLS